MVLQLTQLEAEYLETLLQKRQASLELFLELTGDDDDDVKGRESELQELTDLIPLLNRVEILVKAEMHNNCLCKKCRLKGVHIPL